MTNPGYIAIIGSGELSDSMAEVHRQLMARLPGPARPIFIDSLAGFELNIDQIDRKAIGYFQRNFGLEPEVARYRRPDDPPAAVADAVLAIQRANYLLAGPGSPSYGVKLWRDSQMWAAIVSRWQEGAGLVFASAASIVLGEYAIPVYEIYKAGHDVHWLPGLDLLGQIGVQAAVVPHWNNQSGEQHDTRFCFMGAPRFAQLESMLPPDVLIIGVDEYSALLIDCKTAEGKVLGNGQVTLRRNGCQMTYVKGDSLSLLEGCGEMAPAVPLDESTKASPAEEGGPDPASDDIATTRSAVQAAISSNDLEASVAGLVNLAMVAGAGLEQSLLNRTELAVAALQALLPQLVRLNAANRASDVEAARREQLLNLLVDTRARLRSAGQWALADELRDGLGRLGYTLQDTPDGTVLVSPPPPVPIPGDR